LLQARVPIYVSARSCKPAKPRSTPFANSFFTDGSCNSSPVLINIADHHLHLNQLPNPETAFNIHTSQADHRDRGKRLRLPSCLLIETASNDAPALPVAPCSRRFRCRLATINPERFRRGGHLGARNSLCGPITFASCSGSTVLARLPTILERSGFFECRSRSVLVREFPACGWLSVR
jgi:hypothetical protein